MSKLFSLPAAMAKPLPRVGYSRTEAAEIVGVGVDLFDRAVSAGALPQPRMIGTRLVWDIEELVTAFRELPHKATSLGYQDAPPSSDDKWI